MQDDKLVQTPTRRISNGATAALGDIAVGQMRQIDFLADEPGYWAFHCHKSHAALMLKFPNMAHDEPYMAHVAPGKTGEIVWTINRAGNFGFACLIAGHYQAGMVGRITVAARPPSASTLPSQKGKP